jgi:hypothetical protein
MHSENQSKSTSGDAEQTHAEFHDAGVATGATAGSAHTLTPRITLTRHIKLRKRCQRRNEGPYAAGQAQPTSGDLKSSGAAARARPRRAGDGNHAHAVEQRQRREAEATPRRATATAQRSDATRTTPRQTHFGPEPEQSERPHNQWRNNDRSRVRQLSTAWWSARWCRGACRAVSVS